jgi:NAD(P)-dependent dehydrogenase (short-subunit alcohol dehydrogenase family)
LQRRNAAVAVIGAGDFIGAAIARKFAAEGFVIFAGRRNGDKLLSLIADSSTTRRGPWNTEPLVHPLSTSATRFSSEKTDYATLKRRSFVCGRDLEEKIIVVRPLVGRVRSRRQSPEATTSIRSTEAF